MSVFVLCTVSLLLVFNGIWRINFDSALYRSVARSLANGEGFVHAGLPEIYSYPGLPLLLAAIQRVFGSGDLVPLVVVMACGAGCLLMVHRLIARVYPPEFALAVTAAVGVNGWFIQHTQELLTDIPFMLLSLLTLWSLEQLRRPTAGPARFQLSILMVLALTGSILFRPVGWILAASLLAIGLWRITRGRSAAIRRLGGSMVLLTSLAAGACFLIDVVWLDGRLLRGGYGTELSERLSVFDVSGLLAAKTSAIEDINASFFAQTMNPGGLIFSGILLIGLLVVARRRPEWALPALALVPMTLVMSSDPRYFMAHLPFVWLGYLLLCRSVCDRLSGSWRVVIAVVLIAPPVALNVARSFKVIAEQRRADLALLDGTSRRDAFYTGFQGGSQIRNFAIAESIRRHVEPGEFVVGPDSNILAYLSDRNVLGQRELLRGHDIADYARVLEAHPVRLYVFPMQLYRSHGLWLFRIMQKRFVRPLNLVEMNDGFMLVEVSVFAPPGDWRDHEPLPLPRSRRTRG